MVLIAGTPHNIDQYTSSGSFYVRINDDNGAILSVMDILITSEFDAQDAIMDSYCKDLTTVGGALASMLDTVGTVAAAGFTLASLLCGD